MRRRHVILLALIPLFAIAALLYWLSPDDHAAPSAEEQLKEQQALHAEFTTATGKTPSDFVTGLEGLPPSLEGTEVDGVLEVDANGRLKITSGIRNVFDYFLSIAGEEPMEKTLQRLRAYIRHKLPAGAAAEAEQILDGYLAYKKGLASLPNLGHSSGAIDIGLVRQQMQQVQALRTQYLSAEVIGAFFGNDDAYDRYSLARYEILQNKQLSPQQRAQQLAANEQQLPADMKVSMEEINKLQNLQELTTDWQTRKGSPAELRQIREALVGAEATARLETLDQSRAEWNQRMQTWLQERSSLMNNANLSAQDKQAQLIELRAQRFNASEITRVEALERISEGKR
jgi:lipase chaperone LimK